MLKAIHVCVGLRPHDGWQRVINTLLTSAASLHYRHLKSNRSRRQLYLSLNRDTI